MTKREIKKCVSEMMDSLYNHDGFKDWWDNVDGFTELEIEIELKNILERRINKQQ